MSDRSAGPDEYFRGDAVERLLRPCYAGSEVPAVDGFPMTYPRTEVNVSNIGRPRLHLVMRRTQNQLN